MDVYANEPPIASCAAADTYDNRIAFMSDAIKGFNSRVPESGDEHG
jgi:hypothetical protein